MLYSRPDYQSHTPDQYTTLLGLTVVATGRTTPDVSFNSAIQGGFLAYLGFLSPARWAVFGGTSAASPAWAAVIALLDQANGGPVGFINPAIYNLGASESAFGFGQGNNQPSGTPFHDVTSGNDSDTAGTYGYDGYLAMRGYDLTTGWGSPNVSVFIQAIQQFLQQGGP